MADDADDREGAGESGRFRESEERVNYAMRIYIRTFCACSLYHKVHSVRAEYAYTCARLNGCDGT